MKLDHHILWRHALGAAFVIMGTWIVLTVAYGGVHYWMETEWRTHSVPWGVSFLDGLLENLQSEAWQVGFAAWAFKHFFWTGSPESK